MRARALFLALALALSQTMPSLASADVPAARASARDQSRAAFRRGVEQANGGEWREARRSFETAYALYPHASILLNLGIAKLRSGDPVGAEDDLVRFFNDDRDAPAEELASAREALSEARTKIGIVHVEVSPASARVLVDGRAVDVVRSSKDGNVAVFAHVLPGPHRIRVEADRHAAQEKSVVAYAAKEVRVDVALAPNAVATTDPEPPEEGHSTARTVVGWSLAGLAAGALVTSGVTALHAKSLADDYREPGNARFQDPATRDTGITYRTTADVALGVALVVGATATVLLLTDVGTSKTARAADPLGFFRW